MGRILAAAVAVALIATPLALAGFNLPVYYDAGSQVLDVVARDLDRDGRSDLVVSNRADDTFSVLRGRANGTFRDAVDFPAGPSPLGIAAGDFNGDDRLDLAFANQTPEGGVSIVLAKRQFGFNAPAELEAGGAEASYLVAGRFDDNRKLDLAVTSFGDNAVTILLGRGDGEFKPPLDLALGDSPFPVATADFNRDGTRDLIVGQGTQVSVLLGKGNGKFKQPLSRAIGDDANDVIVARLNGDRRLDVAVASFGGGSVIIMRGKRDGSLGPPQSFAAGATGAGVAAFHYNRDDALDLAVANDGGNEIQVLRGKGDGTFKAALPFAVDGSHYGIARGRFNGDRRHDIATTNYLPGGVAVLIAN